MMVIPLESLPLGFRFRPTDVEIINHYLKRKITGEIGSEVQVIPEIDVCKHEPWDLPVKSLIRSDDSEWFFFAPKDRKYPNCSRANRATAAGFWKATGKDRFIRTKGAKSQPTVIGMKKTLVFHQGRAPKGVRTKWIMHEYRTTEPKFESGNQGSYLVYRLFNKPEERSLNSNAEVKERNVLSPTPSQSSPGEMQYHPNAVEEITTQLDQDSLALPLQSDQLNLPDSVQSQLTGILRQLDNRNDCLTNYPIKRDENDYNIFPHDIASELRAKADPLPGVLAPLPDSNKIIDPDRFPCISSPMTTFPENDPSFGITNQTPSLDYSDIDNNLDLLNELRNLGDPDEWPSQISKAQDESNAGRFEQGDSYLNDPNYFDGSEFHQILAELSDGFPEMESKFNFHSLFEGGSFLAYDGTDPDAYSMDSAADSFHELFSVEDSGIENIVTNNGNCPDGTATAHGAPQEPPLPAANLIMSRQGNAARRLLLQSTLHSGVDSDTSSTKEDFEDQETNVMNSKDMADSVEESTTENSVSTDADSLEPTGINTRIRPEHHCLNSSLYQQGTVVRMLSLQCKVQVRPALGEELMPSSRRTTPKDKVGETEIGEHVGMNRVEESLLEELSVNDGISKFVQRKQEAKGVMKSRKKMVNNDEDKEKKLKGLNAHSRAPGKASGARIACLVFSATLLLLCVAIWSPLAYKSYFGV